jgi:hypothetical protein
VVTDLLNSTPGYSFSRLVVSSILPMHYPESRGALSWLEAMLQVYRAYKKLHPHTYAEELGLLDIGQKTIQEILAERNKEDYPLGGLVLNLLARLFPIDEDIVYEDMYQGEGDGFPAIWIFPQYYTFLYDDIEDMIQNPEDAGPGLSPILFFILFDQQFGKETWDTFKDHFGWPVDYIEAPDRDSYLDNGALARLFRKNGLAPFYDLFMACAYATGNPFIDFDEYGNDRQWDLTLKNILFLKRQWELAQPILENCKEAERMVEEDPKVLIKVAKIICQSFRHRKTKKGQE